MACIKIGSCSIYLLLPFFNSIIIAIYNLLYNHIALKVHPILDNVIASIILILSFIPWIISEKMAKSKIDSTISLYRKEGVIKEKNKNPTLNIVALSVVFFLDNFIESSFEIDDSVDENCWAFEIIFIFLFSFLILKNQIYKHQLLSLIIIFLCGLCCTVLDGLLNFSFINLITFLIGQFSSGLYSVLVKNLLDYYYFSPYKIMFYNSTSCLLINLILLFSMNNVKCTKFTKIDGKNKYYLLRIFKCGIKGNDNEYYFEKISDFFERIQLIYKGQIKPYSMKLSPTLYILIIITYFFTCSLSSFLSIFTIKTLSPFDIYMTSCLLHIILKVQIFITISISKTKESYSKIILIFYFIFILIILFWYFVFQEMIEINCCKLNYNTKKNIMERSLLQANNRSTKSEKSLENDMGPEDVYSESDDYLIDNKKKTQDGVEFIGLEQIVPNS